jgi:hypothetical protein
VEHARECVLDDRLYSYCSGHGTVLLFNCVYEVVGVLVGGHCFTLSALTPTQKVNTAEGEGRHVLTGSLAHDDRVANGERLLTGPVIVCRRWLGSCSRTRTSSRTA